MKTLILNANPWVYQLHIQRILRAISRSNRRPDKTIPVLIGERISDEKVIRIRRRWFKGTNGERSVVKLANKTTSKNGVLEGPDVNWNSVISAPVYGLWGNRGVDCRPKIRSPNSHNWPSISNSPAKLHNRRVYNLVLMIVFLFYHSTLF